MVMPTHCGISFEAREAILTSKFKNCQLRAHLIKARITIPYYNVLAKDNIVNNSNSGGINKLFRDSF